MATITSTIKLVDQMTPTLNKISKAIDRINSQSQNMGSIGGKSFNAFSNGAKNATKHTHNLYNALRRAVFFIGTLKGLQGFATVADSMMNATARIDNINDGLHTTSEYMDLIYEAAQRSRGSFSQMATDIAKLGNNAGAAFNNSVPQMIRFSEILNKSFRVAGISAREASQASYQLTQALASGRLQGDEMRSILENSPIVAQKIADKLGVAVGRVRELGAEGKITSDVIVEAMFEAADDIEKRFAKMPKTLGDIWTQISNYALNTFRPLIGRIQNFINSKFFESVLSRLEQAIKKVADGVMWLFDQFNRPEVHAFLSAIGDLLGFIGQIVMQVAAAVGRAYEWIIANTDMFVNYIHFVIGNLQELWNVFLWVGNIAVSVAMWICDNWSWIGQIVYAVIAMVILYGIYQSIVAAKACIEFIAMGIAGFVSALMAGEAWAWAILIIVALVAVIYIAVNAWNYFTGATVSATGVILGAVAFIFACIADLFIFLWDVFMSLIHIIVAIGQLIWEVCSNIGQVLKALITNFLILIGLLLYSVASVIVLVGANIISTIGWILDCVATFAKNMAIGMAQLCQLLPEYWEYFRAAVNSKFWGLVVGAGQAFNNLLRGASNLCKKLVKPFENFVNAVIDMLNGLIGAWNSLCEKLTLKIPGLSIPGIGEVWGEQEVKLVGGGIEKLSHVSWTGWSDPEGIDLAGATGQLNLALNNQAALKNSLPEINWNTYAMPDNPVDWGNIGDALGDIWTDVPWMDSGVDFSGIWGDLVGNLDKTWDSSDYFNPVDAFNNWYEKGEQFENGVGTLVDSIGSLLGAVFGDNSSKGDSEKPSSKDKDNLLDYDQLIKNATPNVSPSLENLLDNAGGGGGSGGSGKKPANALDKIANATGNTADSTGNIEDTLDLAEEELELLRKLAEQEIINRFTTAEIHVDMTNNNNISSGMDLDGIVTHLSNKLYEELGVVASGVHY